MAKYYTLLIKEKVAGSKWEIHFGDFDKEVVKEERVDVLDSWECQGIKGRTQIVMTEESQKDLDAYVLKLNSSVLGEI